MNFSQRLLSWYKSRPRDRRNITLRDLMEKLDCMSQQILAVVAAVNAAFDKTQAALVGIRKDIEILKQGGAVTPEARAALADIETRANSIAEASKALDDEMPDEGEVPPVDPNVPAV